MSEILGMGLGLSAMAAMAVVPIALLSLAVPYLVLRLGDEARTDPQLGAKIAFQFFYSASVLCVLAGLTISVADLATREASRSDSGAGGMFGGGRGGSNVFNESQRLAVGLMLSGLIGAAVHAQLLKRTTPDHRPRVRRLFVGWRWAIHGVVVMLTLTALIVLLLQRGAFEEPLYSSVKTFVTTLVIWGTSWLVHLSLLTATMRKAGERQTGATPPRIES